MRLEHTDPLAAFLLRSPLGALVRGVAHLRASVRSKLLGAFLLVTLLFLLMGAFSVQTIRRMSQHTDALDGAHQRVAWSYQLQHSLAMQMHLTGMALLVRDEATVANILRENNRFNDTLGRIEAAAPSDERARVLLVTVERVCEVEGELRVGGHELRVGGQQRNELRPSRLLQQRHGQNFERVSIGRTAQHGRLEQLISQRLHLRVLDVVGVATGQQRGEVAPAALRVRG